MKGTNHTVTSALSPSCLRRSAARFLLAAALVIPVIAVSRAQNPNYTNRNKPSISDHTREVFGKLKPLVEERNWDEALALLNELVATVPPESYDMAFILDTKAGILAQQDDMSLAIQPWEGFLRLCDKYHYYDRQHVNEVVHYLAQIYFQVGSTIKFPPGSDSARLHEEQRVDFEKAVAFTKRWSANQAYLTQDDEESYANQLYNLAVCNPDKADDHLLVLAEKETKKGLLMAIHPRDQLYELLVLIYQQQGDFERLSQYLELLAKLKPDSKAYWPQLMSVYLTLAGNNEKDKAKFHAYYARAILALERAQEHGVLKDPKNNYNLVSMYYSVGQFATATDLLSAGLRNETISSTEQNWRILAYCYEQLNEYEKAIGVYKEAEQHLPEAAGQFDFDIARTYTQMDKETEAYDYYRSAVAKGHLSSASGYSAYLNIAFAGYELHHYDEALAACDAAAKFPEAAKDKQLPNLRQGIQDEMNKLHPAPKPAPEPEST